MVSIRFFFKFHLPKLDSRGALGPLSMVLVCGSMTKTWVLPISEVFDLFLDKISMAFAACFLIHSSEQKIQPSFGCLSQQKQVFFLTTTWNKKTTIYYIFINWHKWYHRKGLKYIIYYPKMNLIYNCKSRSKYFPNVLHTYPRCFVSNQSILVMTKYECWTFVLKFTFFFQLTLNISFVQENFDKNLSSGQLKKS